jgi:glycosyltransferase involved in cell wall biosynthesis
MSQVSVIIPTYNQARFVASAVESALAQTYPDVEIIVVDDGSTDDPRAALAPYRARIHYIRQENKGLSGARNTGFLASHGDYVLFLDSDDLIHPWPFWRLNPISAWLTPPGSRSTKMAHRCWAK